ncbi:antibiotic biosynthesis monooxygenase family protein [Streptomyces sp. NPDC056470]|uniref:antibiotic biosynthesis monooxygenase family protein n=1 Tax=Streptomyces sp. NPDC056470 TaxID=3345831 RepID=UPI0036B57F75
MYVLIYEYEVGADQRSRFEKIYGSSGQWSELFRKAPGYLGTDLFRRVDETGDRYLVVDRWADEQAFRAFKASFAGEYDRFSEQTRRLYRTETVLGSLSTFSQA